MDSKCNLKTAVIEIKNILKYTLLLDYEVPEVYFDVGNNNDKTIDELLSATHKCCSQVIGSGSSLIYDFFGSNTNIRESESLIRMAYSMPGERDESTLHSLILQDCVMMAYHTIVQEFSRPYHATPYTIQKLRSAGLFKAVKKKIISEKDERIHKSTYGEIEEKGKLSSQASNHRVKFHNSVKSYPPFEVLLRKPLDDSSSPDFNIGYASTISKVVEINASTWKGLLKKDYSVESIEHLDSIMEKFLPYLKDEAYMESFISGHFGTSIVDGIYHYYIAEKITNIRLLYTMLLLVRDIPKRTSYYFDSPYIVETLCKCVALPNVFSRNFFLKFAFDFISINTRSFKDFWNGHNIEKRHSIGDVGIPNAKLGFQLGKWLEQYERFVIFMGNYLIPIYQWCFITMIYTISDKWNQSNERETQINLIKILGQYILNNCHRILLPVDCDGKNDLSVIMKPSTNIQYLLDGVSPDTIRIIKDHFFLQHQTILDLQKLDRSNYKKQVNNLNAVKQVNDLYIEHFIERGPGSFI